jgi:hypothetical protein
MPLRARACIWLARGLSNMFGKQSRFQLPLAGVGSCRDAITELPPTVGYRSFISASSERFVCLLTGIGFGLRAFTL